MTRPRSFQSWDDYHIPGTTVLKNKFTAPGKPDGETDSSRLMALEEHYARSRLIELAEIPIDGDFDYAHMKAIHQYRNASDPSEG